MKAPGTKHQAPRGAPERASAAAAEKHQDPSSNGCPAEWPGTMLQSNRSRRLGFWNLELLWSLDFGAWSFVTMLAFLLLTAGCQHEQTTRSTASPSSAEAAKTSTRRDEPASRAAFLAAYPVFMHQRS